MALYEIESKRELSTEDWDGLRGTALYEQMFRNHARLTVRGNNPVAEAAEKAFRQWLTERVECFYYVEKLTSGVWMLYFEEMQALVAFTLAHKGEETPDVPKPPKTPNPPKTRPPTALPKLPKLPKKPWVWPSINDDDDDPWWSEKNDQWADEWPADPLRW